MKTIVASILCGLLLALPVSGQTTNTPTVAKPVPTTVWPCVIVLSAIAIGSIIIISVYSTTCGACRDKKLVLERDFYDGNWTPVATNLVNVCTNKLEIFRERITDPNARYRVRVCPLTPQ